MSDLLKLAMSRRNRLQAEIDQLNAFIIVGERLEKESDTGRMSLTTPEVARPSASEQVVKPFEARAASNN